MWGALGAILLLGLLDAATSSQGAADRAGGLIGAVAKTVQRIVDPTVPAIPDRSTSGSGSTPGSSSGGGGGDPFKIPDIPGLPQGPITGLPFSPVSTKAKPPKPIPSQPVINA